MAAFSGSSDKRNSSQRLANEANELRQHCDGLKPPQSRVPSSGIFSGRSNGRPDPVLGTSRSKKADERRDRRNRKRPLDLGAAQLPARRDNHRAAQ